MNPARHNPDTILKDLSWLLRPPRRVPVSQTAAEVVKIADPGGYNGPWDPAVTPYMVEPMDALQSRRYRAVVFCGPARSGKTQALIDGWISHAVTADPGDMGAFFPTEQLSMDFRKRRVERLHKHSEEMRRALSSRKHDNTLRKITYKNGMILDLSYPTSGQVAQRTFRYVAASDYDSFPDDISGEGAPFDLILMRTQTAGSAGMGLFESSPKRPIVRADWKPTAPHEAPPVGGGILPLYNRGDRRRWYWQCIDSCGGWFEAPALPAYEPFTDPNDAADTAHVACPHCGQKYRPDKKPALNRSPAGKWHPENAVRSRDNDIQAPTSRAKFASFWMLGTAAAFVSWDELVRDELTAAQYFKQTGDDRSLITKRNTQQGLPYLPPTLQGTGLAGILEARKTQQPRYQVPPRVRTLLGSVDQQQNRFEVAIWGFTDENELWLVDRYKINKTENEEDVRPMLHAEHWDVLADGVINATYRLTDGRKMRVAQVVCDSGGAKGSTANAYAYWRRLRQMGMGNRLLLAKGEDRRGRTGHDELVRLSWPDTRAKDRATGGTGDVPLLLVNSNQIRDLAFNRLSRDAPGSGYIHFPDWTPQSVFQELAAETKAAGKWTKIPGRANESWDLLCYALALWTHIRGDQINWRDPPPWAQPCETNSNVLDNDGRQKLVEQTKKRRIQIGKAYQSMVR